MKKFVVLLSALLISVILFGCSTVSQINSSSETISSEGVVSYDTPYLSDEQPAIGGNLLFGGDYIPDYQGAWINFCDWEASDKQLWLASYEDDIGSCNFATYVEYFDVSLEDLLEIDNKSPVPFGEEFLSKLYLPPLERFQAIGNPYAVFMPDGEIYDPWWWHDHSVEEWKEAGLTYEVMEDAISKGIEGGIFFEEQKKVVLEKLDEFAVLMGVTQQ